jgi:hypothetical protein
MELSPEASVVGIQLKSETLAKNLLSIVLIDASAGACGTPTVVAAVVVRDGTPGASVVASVVLLSASVGAHGTPAVVAAVVVRDGTPGAPVSVRICVGTSLPASTIPYTPLWFVWSGLVVVVVAFIGGVAGGETVGAQSAASVALVVVVAFIGGVAGGEAVGAQSAASVALVVVVVAFIGGVAGGEAVGAQSAASVALALALALALAPASAAAFPDSPATVAAGCDLASTLSPVVLEKTNGGSAMSRSEKSQNTS